MSSCPYSKIPGKPDYPIFGDTLAFIFEDPIELVNRKRKKYGDMYKVNVFNQDSVLLIKPDMTKWTLLDHAKDFNSKEAWDNVLKDLFPNGLMLMDGDHHRSHRSVIAEVFKNAPMEGYLKMMIPLVDEFVNTLTPTEHKMFPLYKEWTIKVALKVFFGLDPKNELKEINKAITNIVKAAASLHINLPFTTYGKGVSARKYLIQFFSNLITERRSNPGDDLFSKLCIAEGEDGEKFSDDEVIDHLIFILMAAHDTTASSLTSLSYELTQNTEWQEMIREEALKLFSSQAINQKTIRGMEKTSLAVKETLRIYPPLTSITRVTNKDVSYGEYHFPKGTFFSIPISYFQLDKDIWDHPNVWDPERFNKERREDRKCPYAYSPFGAGLHHCIGSVFAEMLINLTIGKLLERFDFKVPNDYKIPMKAVPLQEPRDGFPMILKTR
jgi:cytochrome P450